MAATRGRDFIARLATDRLVGCGAHSGQFVKADGTANTFPELVNLTRPDAVRRVYGEFVDAGAHLIATNTIAANSFVLQRLGMAAKMREINLAGARLAVESAGTKACVAGAIGPLGITLDEDWDFDTVCAAYRDQISALLEGGVQLIQFESFTNLAELRLAVKQAQAVCGTGIPVVALMTFNDGGHVESGEDAADVARALVAAGADVIGVNCGRGIAGAAKAAEHMVSGAGVTPVAAYPNAGYPEAADGQIVYRATPAYMADTAVRLAKTGVRLLGGCCGVSPDIIRAMALSLTTVRPNQFVRGTLAPTPAVVTAASVATPAFKDGGFLRGLKYAMPIIAEIDPPGHLQYKPLIEDARVVADTGADAISLAENPLASLKMGNVAVASILRRELGVQTICHMTCRDRNILGTQSELMGAHALDIQAILAITGDPLGPSSGTGRSVFDLNSMTLTRLIAALNRGVSHTGASLKGETDFSIGVAFNSAARNLVAEEQRLQKKVAEGARFIMTQPVFDVEHAQRILDITRRSGLRVFLGFFPLLSARTALYLHNEVPGMKIPEPILQRLTSLSSKEDQKKAGMEMASRVLDQLADSLDGVYLISPHNRPRTLAPLIRLIRAWPQGSRLTTYQPPEPHN